MAQQPIVRPSQRVSGLSVEGAFAVLARAEALGGRLTPPDRVVHLEIGQPDFATPPHIVEAGLRALRNGDTRYAPPAGLPALREAIAVHVGARGIRASANRVLVTPGAKTALYCALAAVMNPGDAVLVPDPGFPAYASMVHALGGRTQRYEVDARNGVDVAAVAARITARTRVLVLNAPHNPTGTTISAETAGALAALAERHDLTIVSDEIYSALQFDRRAASPAAHPAGAARTIVVDGFSKAYAMTGWRLGYAILPRDLAHTAEPLATNLFSCTATFVQQAGLAALTGAQTCVAEMREEYALRAHMVAEALNRAPGISCPSPRGAFYAFADVGGLRLSADVLARRLLDESHVALLPGTAFGPGGAGHLRLSFGGSRGDISLGLSRIRAFVTALGNHTPTESTAYAG